MNNVIDKLFDLKDKSYSEKLQLHNLKLKAQIADDVMTIKELNDEIAQLKNNKMIDNELSGFDFSKRDLAVIKLFLKLSEREKGKVELLIDNIINSDTSPINEAVSELNDNKNNLDMVSIKEAAELIKGVTENTVRHLVKQGKIKALHVGKSGKGKFVINKQEYLEYFRDDSSDQDKGIEMVSIKEAAELIKGVSESTVRQLVKQGKIKAIRLGEGENGKYAINKHSFLKYFNS